MVTESIVPKLAFLSHGFQVQTHFHQLASTLLSPSGLARHCFNKSHFRSTRYGDSSIVFNNGFSFFSF